MKCIRVAIVDDHTLFRAGLKALLRDSAEFALSGEAASGAEALRLVAETKPDVLLLDLGLPDSSGIALLGKLAAASPETRVIVLTMHNDAALARAALAAGAGGYVVKTAADTELRSAIRCVAQGRTFVDLDLKSAQIAALLDSTESALAAARGPLAPLSGREREVFRWLAEGHTNQAIAERLDLSVKTVETYRARIGEKLGLRSRTDLIRFAVAIGALSPGEGQF